MKQLADADLLDTACSQTVYIGMDSRVATGTQQWLLEKSLSHSITTGNTLQTFIGGEEGFRQIAADLDAARQSIDLVCWGFDPGMALVRAQSRPAHPWAMGEPYGELLRRKAAQGVLVRLLVWYSPRGSAVQNSLVGYVNPDEPMSGGVINVTSDEMGAVTSGMSSGIGGYAHAPARRPAPSVAEQRQDYCTRWWREATAGMIPNLEVRCRDGVAGKVKASVGNEADPPSAAGGQLGGYFDEKELIENWATHHQKPILIDYGHAGKSAGQGPGHKAVGFIMGLNSVSDYWDSAEHRFDDPLREKDHEGRSDALSRAVARTRPISRKPLRDYACRIEGPALIDVYRNFSEAWNRAALLPKLRCASNAGHQAVRSADLNPALAPAALARTDAAPLGLRLRLQVLRTQPEEGGRDVQGAWPFDKSIKQAYFQATASARNYLYLENQYFFYEEWARHLKAKRQAFMKGTQAAKAASRQAPPLHLMVVIPTPENDGMVPRTYDTLKSLGQAHSMPHQHRLVQERSEDGWLDRSVSPGATDIARSALRVRQPTLDKEGVLMQDGKSLGLKVLVARLVSQNRGGNAHLGQYRDIYIHSKLMLADDCFMTLGSANLNQRSMAADSEINVATDHIPHNRALRQRVWGQLTGGDRNAIGGSGSPQEMVEAFERWRALASNNAKNIRSGKSIAGLIVEFKDERTATERVG